MGRREEVAALRDDLADPHVAGAVVTGPAGIGKTALLRQVVRATAVPPLWWRASEALGEVPFGLLGPSLVGPDDPTPAAVHRRVAAAIADGGGIVVVDDAPHVDAASADLLRRLVDAGKATVLATARSEAPVPPWLEWLWVHPEVRHHQLGPLGEADVDDLAAAVLAGVPAAQVGRVLATVRARAAGNALFVRELLLDAARRQARGLPVAGEREVPPQLRRVLDARRRAAGAPAESALQATAVLGSLPLDLLVARVGAPAVEAAEAAGLVAVDEGERPAVRPAHPLHAEAALAALPVVRRRAVTTEVAGAVLDRPDGTRPERLAAVAALVRQGTPPGREHLLEAARTAFATLDHHLAIAAAEAAVRAGDRFEARVVLGAALSGAGRDAEAEAVLRDAVAAARDDDERVRAAGRLSVHLVAHGSRVGEADAVLAEVEATVEDPAALAFLRADRAKLATIRGELVAAVAPPGGDDLAVLNAAIAGAYVQAMAGDAAACRATIGEALPLAAAHRDVLPWSGELVRFSGPFAALVEAGPAAALAEAGAGLAAADPDEPATVGTWRFLCGFTATVLGDLSRADRDLGAAAEALAAHDLIGAGPLAVAARAWAAAQAGDVDRARDLVDDALPAAEVDGRVRTQLAVAEAWCDAVEGRRSPAVARLADAARGAIDEGQVVPALLALHEAVRLGGAPSARPLLDRVAREAPASWLLSFVTDRAGAEDDPPALADLAGRAAGRWPAAEAELHARRAQLLGDGDPAGSARARVAAVVAARALPRPPWLLRDLAWPLTERETEVATRVAQGATSRAVAEAAGVSVRTVENQLQSVYRKLGLAGRRELAAALGLPAGQTSSAEPPANGTTWP